MKMSALVGLALVVGFGILLSSCSSNVGPPQGGDAPFHHLKNGFRNPPDSPKRDIPFKRRIKFFSEAVWRNAVSKPPTIPTDHAVTRDEAKAQLVAWAKQRGRGCVATLWARARPILCRPQFSFSKTFRNQGDA